MACLAAMLVLIKQCDSSSVTLRYHRSHAPISELWLTHDTRFFLEVAFYGLHLVLIEGFACLFSHVIITHPVLPELLIMPSVSFFICREKVV